MREHLEALFDLLSRELGGLSGKFPPSPCGLSLPCWRLSLVVQQPLGEIYGSLKASNFAPRCSWRIWKGFEALVLPENFWKNSAAWDHLMHHIQVKGEAVVGFSGLALCFFFLFSFFHVDKAVFHLLQGFTCQEPADICSSVHFEDVELFAGWGQRAQKVEE